MNNKTFNSTTATHRAPPPSDPPQQPPSKQTPAQQQYWDFKKDNMDVVLFFKVGKFYELFHLDADVGHKELDLIYMKGPKAHAGFPEIAFGKFSEQLVARGFRVAGVEQTETPDLERMDALAASQRAADAADPSSWKDHLQAGTTQGCICRRAGEECRDPNCAWRTKAATAQPAADVLDLCDSDDSDNAGAPKTDIAALTRTADEGAGAGGAKEASSVGRKVKDMVAGAASQVATAAAAVAQLMTPKKRREQKRWSREEGAAAGSAAGSADRQPQEKKQRITKQVAQTVGATFPALSLTSTPLSIAASRSNSSDVDEDDDDDVAETGHQRSGQFTL